jgi:2-polyprenyl-6-methoxyphenol hydroxylase-like FAD-dependent oxidoreductase
MTKPLNKVLVIGGGFTGMSVALALNNLDIEVDLVEIDPDWRTDGAGVTVSGPSLRAIDALGLTPAFEKHGAIHKGFELRNSGGDLILGIPPMPVPGTDIVGGGGIMRPLFAKAIGEMVLLSGVNVKLGCTYESIEQTEDEAIVTLTDGTKSSYDLVIGADGVYSSVRKQYFPEAPEPKYTGQGVWRAVTPRFDIDKATQFAGRAGKIGFTPVSDTEMYLFYTQRRPDNTRIEPDTYLPRLMAILEEFDAPVIQKIKACLDESSQIIYRPLEGMMMPRPWFDNRLLLMGDAVHATTPHLASGAGMGHEDAVVLGLEVEKGGSLNDILDRYQNRRWSRCSLVVNNSLRLGEIEKKGYPYDEHAQLMALSMNALLAPI